MKKVEAIRFKKYKKNDEYSGLMVIDTNDLDWSESYYFEGGDESYQQPDPPPPLCVYCNEPWTPRMEKLMVTSGYCETCFESSTLTVIVCDNCNRIIYRK